MADDNSHRSHSRRTLLKTVGAASVATPLLGAASAAEATEEVAGYEFQFDRIVNVKREGGDPTGEEPVDPIVDEYTQDNTLIYFPPGRYKLEQFHIGFGTDLENFGLRGAGTGQTTLVPRDGHGSPKYGSGYADRVFVNLWGRRNLLFEGFTVDYTAENTGGRMQVLADDGVVCRDVEVEGVNDTEYGPTAFGVTEAGGSGIVDRVRLPDGGDDRMYGANGMFVSPRSEGDLTIRNCVIVGFPDNGLYASNPSDPAAVRVEGGYYANSNISQVRLGTARSYVRNARIEVTERIDTDVVNMRGVRQADGSGVTVKNCDIVMSADANASGAIVSNRTSGELFVENTRIRTDAPFADPAIRMKSNDGTAYSGGLHARNVSITGDTEGGAAVTITDRADNTLENVCVEQTGADRDGLLFRRSEGRITNAVLDVTGEPVVTEGDAEVETTRVRYEGSCPAPAPR